jgi:hypothetical protein
MLSEITPDTERQIMHVLAHTWKLKINWSACRIVISRGWEGYVCVWGDVQRKSVSDQLHACVETLQQILAPLICIVNTC